MGKFWPGTIGEFGQLCQNPLFTDTLKMYLAYTLTVAYDTVICEALLLYTATC